jgi:hypothetical protein
MYKSSKRKEKINFLLLDKEYRRLHLVLYLLSVFVIVSFYFMTVFLFASYSNTLLTAIFSIIVGVTLVFQRDRVVKIISEKLEDKKRRDYKKKNKEGLHKTLKHITPKNKRKFKLNLNDKNSFKKKVFKVVSKLSPKERKKEKKGYVEVK